jgi:hypothetical protein
MKNDNVIYSIGCMAIIAGTIMKILHLPYGNSILVIGFVGMSIFQSWHVTQLKRRIKELESKAGN